MKTLFLKKIKIKIIHPIIFDLKNVFMSSKDIDEKFMKTLKKNRFT